MSHERVSEAGWHRSVTHHLSLSVWKQALQVLNQRRARQFPTRETIVGTAVLYASQGVTNDLVAKYNSSLLP